MKDFFDKLIESYDYFNTAYTENGALSFRTTGNFLLDLQFAVSSLRSVHSSIIRKLFSAAYFENKLLAIKWLFFAADVREGMGERRLFRTCLKFIAETDPQICRALIPFVAEYTRWDNLFALEDTALYDDVCALIKEQLEKDLLALSEGKNCSLCAKWLPSVNTTSDETKSSAKLLINKLGYTAKEYRKKLSALRKYLDVVEVKMSDKRFGEIDYSTVPSRANLLYRNAFLKNDEARRLEYLDNLKKGNAKINSKVLFPHDIVSKYVEGYDQMPKEYDETLEQLWKNLPDYVQSDDSTICVVDGSGSMSMYIGKTNVTAWSVAAALGIYFSERCSGQFKDRFITFSEHPQLVDMSNAKTLHDKIGIATSYDEVANTDIEAVFNLILKTAIDHKLKQEDLPTNVLIISDMEFDECAYDANYRSFDKKLFEVIAEKYEKHGYDLPRLVFWNVNSRTLAIPVQKNKLGVILVSGFSPTVLQMVFTNELDPLKALIKIINTARYEPIENAVKELV